RTLRGVSRQTPKDHALDKWIKIRNKLGRTCWRCVASPETDQLRQTCCVKSSLPGEQLIQNESQRIDIASRGHVTAIELFRRHVRRRSRHRFASTHFACECSDAKVSDTNFATLVEHDVLWL